MHADEQLEPGHRLGRFRLVRRIATGQVADVYLARRGGMDGFERYVVLKCLRLRDEAYAQNGALRYLLDEARFAARLHHQNIAQVYELSQRNGVYFLVMEYIHGVNLSQVLAELRARGSFLPIQHALTITAGVAAGLHHAHTAVGPDRSPIGLVHRDVSPNNVMVTFDGGVKVIDFGIAKAASMATRTPGDQIQGTVSYMSPEQCAGWDLDHRSDVFSLGAMLYELTTLHRPFAGGDNTVMSQLLTTEARPPSQLVAGYPPELEHAILRAMNRSRDLRHATARDLVLELENLAVRLQLPLSALHLGDFVAQLFGRRPLPWAQDAESARAPEQPAAEQEMESADPAVPGGMGPVTVPL